MDHLAEWVQAAASIAALVGVFIAARMPIQEQQRERVRVDKMRAEGLSALLIGELVALSGAIDRAMAERSPANQSVQIPVLLSQRIDSLYLLGKAGDLLLRAIGAISALQIQVDAASHRVGTPQQEAALWEIHGRMLTTAKQNVDSAVVILRSNAAKLPE